MRSRRLGNSPDSISQSDQVLTRVPKPSRLSMRCEVWARMVKRVLRKAQRRFNRVRKLSLKSLNP